MTTHDRRFVALARSITNFLRRIRQEEKLKASVAKARSKAKRRTIAFLDLP